MKNTLFLARIRTADGETETNLYTVYNDFFRDTFSPCVEVLSVFPFCVSGKTYAEKKSCLRDLAIDFQHTTIDFDSMSWWAAAEIENFFDTMGKRYGLLREFRENAIC